MDAARDPIASEMEDDESLSSDDERTQLKRPRIQQSETDVESSHTSMSEKIKELEAELKNLSKRRSSSISVGEKLDILIFAKKLTLRHMRTCLQTPGMHYGRPRIHKEVVELLQRTKRDVADCVAEWTRSRSITQKPNRGNRTNHASRMPNSKAMVSKIQQYLREQHQKEVAVTSNQLLQQFLEMGWMHVDGLDAKSVAVAERAMQRWLLRNGFCMGSLQSKGSTWMQDPNITRKVDEYLSFKLTNAASSQPFREIYLDEGYIDMEDSTSKNSEKKKSRRFCFVAAIAAASRDPVHDICDAVSPEAQLLLSTLDIIEAKSKVDYHVHFGNNYFTNWFEKKLLPSLPRQPCCIIMDDAKYHCKSSSNINASSISIMNNEYLVALLRDAGVPTEGLLPPQLRTLARAHLQQVIAQPSAVQSAERLGHKVVFTPPRHSRLQPMELLWAKVKTACAQVREEVVMLTMYL